MPQPIDLGTVLNPLTNGLFQISDTSIIPDTAIVRAGQNIIDITSGNLIIPDGVTVWAQLKTGQNGKAAATRRREKLIAGIAKRYANVQATDVMANPPPIIDSSGFVPNGYINLFTPTLNGQLINFVYDSARFVPANNNVDNKPTMRAYGTKPYIITANAQICISNSMGVGVVSGNTSSPWKVGFYHFGRRFNVGFETFGAGVVRFKVDGKYVSKSSTVLASNGLTFRGLDFSATYTISGISTANPGVVTTTAPHGLTSGDGVVISGVVGATGSNGTWSITVLSATTFSIPANITVAYTSGGSVLTGFDVRLIEIEMGINVFVRGMVFDKTDSVSDPGPLTGGSSVIVGDSFGGGTMAIEPTFNGFTQVLAEELGLANVYVDSVGGTGYNKPLSGSQGYLVREQYAYPNVIVPSGGIDLAIIFGSVNDDPNDPLLVSVATQLYAVYGPNVAVVVAIADGPNPHNGNIQGTVTKLQQAAAASPNVIGFLDLTHDVNGTGYENGPAANGNGDFFIGTDNVHPTSLGHKWYGKRIANYIKSLALAAS